MEHVCRCLTAFSSQTVLIDHTDRCQNQKPTNIAFSYKDHLEFEDHMKVPVAISVYADFDCFNQLQNDPNNPNVLFKQIPIAVRFYLISPIGKQYYSNSGLDCASWFVSEMFNLKQCHLNMFSRAKDCNGFVMSPEVEQHFEESTTTCWLCEEPFDSDTATLASHTVKVSDHDHLTGKYKGAADNMCNLNCKQKSSSFVLYFSIISVVMIVILHLNNSSFPNGV